jgi:SAM-dependent methyltransferase
MSTVIVGSSPRVLEIGSGSGSALHGFLAERSGATGVATEVSAPALRRIARGKSVAVQPLASSALEIPLRDQSVDAVVAFEVIEHLPDVAKALDEMLRVVRRPGHIIIGLPNHASLWTPIEDGLRRRTRRAFGVEHGRGAWRWWKRNAHLTWRKRISRDPEFLYRQPVLKGVRGGDADAVYYAAPIDLLRFFRRRGVRLVMTSAQLTCLSSCRVRRSWHGELGRLLFLKHGRQLEGQTQRDASARIAGDASSVSLRSVHHLFRK